MHVDQQVRLKMWKTPSRERICEVQALDGNTSTQRYIQQQRRYSDFVAISPSTSTNSSTRRRASEIFKSPTGGTSPGIVCSNTDLISILSSLTSSATEINRCGEDPAPLRDDSKAVKTIEQKRRHLKDFRSNSFDISILHGTGNKPTYSGSNKNCSINESTSSNWFVNRHQPMWKKQNRTEVHFPLFTSKFDKSKVVKAVKESLTKSTSPPKESSKHKVVWDDTSGTKVDAQVLGSAIEEFLTSQRSLEPEATGSTTALGKSSVSPSKQKPSKVTNWFSGAGKEEEQTETCEPSICSSLKDLFVK